VQCEAALHRRCHRRHRVQVHETRHTTHQYPPGHLPSHLYVARSP
jgi:hypothetical protein